MRFGDEIDDEQQQNSINTQKIQTQIPGLPGIRRLAGTLSLGEDANILALEVPTSLSVKKSKAAEK
ncbi:MAG: hypothetical protein AB2745_17365 [Candidatus Thiodiazotropha endolucinida]|nr:hypothetical protein [Candidatus Thiodiazotropha endolucinida]